MSSSGEHVRPASCPEKKPSKESKGYSEEHYLLIQSSERESKRTVR